jgi:hypothetical protein
MGDWPDWVEEMFEPIRRKSVEANAARREARREQGRTETYGVDLS